MELRLIGPGDDGLVSAPEHLLDGPADPGATRRFLEGAGHHLVIAYVEDRPAGFVTGIEMTHPDKGTEMFLYELGVDEESRRQGLGRALVERLRDLARERGCYGMWALTEETNAESLGTYERADVARTGGQVVLDWKL